MSIQFGRLLFIWKVITMFAHLLIRRRTVARIKRLESQQVSSRQRIKRYLRLQRRQTRAAHERLVFELCKPKVIYRFVWIKDRSCVWWDTVVELSFKDADWPQNFRMRKRIFAFICNTLSCSLKKEDTQLRRVIPIRKRVGVAIWRLATNSDYRTIGHLFGISTASVCLILDEFCIAMATVMLPSYIKIPTHAELIKVVDEFQSKWGFPQCAGAIDGSHIPIKAPTEYHTDFYNRKGWYSIILQAVVDSNYKFIDIYVGWPGKVHDARVFSSSSVFEKGQRKQLFVGELVKTMNGIKVPFNIIADAAYPLLPWVMKPFSDNGNVSPEKAHFNYRLSRARMVVDNAFGHLKGRWRCLLKQNESDLARMNNIVAACCVLHNICETFKDDFDPELLRHTGDAGEENINRNNHEFNDANVVADDAESIRAALVQYCRDVPA